MFKFNYSLISNTCIASMIYKLCNVKQDNIFLMTTITDYSFYNLMINYKSIFNSVKITSDVKQPTEMRILMEKNILHEYIINKKQKISDIIQNVKSKNIWFHEYQSYDRVVHHSDVFQPKVVLYLNNSVEVTYSHLVYNFNNVKYLLELIKKLKYENKEVFYLYEAHNYTLKNLFDKIFEFRKDRILLVNNLIDVDSTLPTYKLYLDVCKKYVIPYLIKQKIIEEV